MRIALHNSFPEVALTAEKEFIARCIVVFEGMGHDAVETLSTSEIIAFDPEIVLVTHELSPKLTHHFTAGIVWNPISYLEADPLRFRNIATWDIVFPASEALRRMVADLLFPLKSNAVSDQIGLYPSSQIVKFDSEAKRSSGLCYVGAGWDADRHRELLVELSRRLDLSVYGPARAWSFIARSYKGEIPVDGRSVVDTLRQHTTVLAIHKNTHLAEDIPSSRVFESCAAQCVTITDSMDSVRATFGDNLYYIDTSRPPVVVADDIAAVVSTIERDAAAASHKVRNAYRIFCETTSLDVVLPRLVEKCREQVLRGMASSDASARTVSVIIRCGGRSLDILSRAVRSVEDQDYGKISLIFVLHDPVDGFEAYLERIAQTGRFVSAKALSCSAGSIRSNALWQGLRSVESELFAILDDDDEWFPDHISHLVALISDEVDVAYSGTVVHCDAAGPAGGMERRRLMFFQGLDIRKLLRWDNFVASHAFVAKSRLLDADVLSDPGFEIMEDYYLTLILLAKGARYRFNQRASAIWHWPSTLRSNSAGLEAGSQANLAKCRERIRRRLDNFVFPGGLKLDTELDRDARRSRHRLKHFWKWRGKRLARLLGKLAALPRIFRRSRTAGQKP